MSRELPVPLSLKECRLESFATSWGRPPRGNGLAERLGRLGGGPARLAAQADAKRARLDRRLGEPNREIGRLVDAIKGHSGRRFGSGGGN
jgi:hypothetical protein